MVDNTKLYFSSQWDIDQLLYKGEIDNITLSPTGLTLTFIILQSFSLSYPPVVDGTFQVVDDTVWRQFGDPTTSGLVNLQTFIASNSGSVQLAYYNLNVSPLSVNVRYYVWTDKINY